MVTGRWTKILAVLTVVGLGGVFPEGFPGGAEAASLPAVKPVLACKDIANLDLTHLEGAPARINSAEEVAAASGKVGYCKVTGYVASDVRFEVRLPLEGWSQQFLMVGCGGYCGFVGVNNDSVDKQSAGCAALNAGTMATAATDLGHQKSATFFPDGLWAQGNPDAIVDFAYAGMHKTTLLAKALIKAYYRQAPKYSYYSGCSDGGREGLQEVQRFPADFDGVVVGSPVIDEVATNTFYHAWGVRSNSGYDGTAILTAKKMPVLIAAVIKACGDPQGLIVDPRACKVDLSTITCKPNADEDFCLTAAQAGVVRKLWSGPVDAAGNHLSAGDMPVGSEAAWAGTMVPKEAGQKMTLENLGDYQWSYDFPNYMAQFGQPSGVTNQNIAFDRESFERLNALSALYDPTNPDLAAFEKHGGKLIIWQGWADFGVSPYISLNYVSAVRAAMGKDADKFLALYMLPGVYHCNLYGGPTTSQEDFLTPIMDWVEDGKAPDKVIVDYTASKDGAIPAKSRPAFPYPAQAVYRGSGDVDAAASYVRADPKEHFSDRLTWLGSDHYTPGRQMWCEAKGATMACITR